MSSSWAINPESTQPNGSNAHIIQTPLPFKFFLGVVWFVSAAIVGLTAYTLRLGGSYYATIWALIIACATLIGAPYILTTSSIQAAASLYHRRAVLALLIAGTAFWASAIASLAREVSGAANCETHVGSFHRDCDKLPPPKGQPYYKEMLAALVLAGIDCVLLLIDLIIYGVLERRARLEGRPMSYWVAQRNAGYQDAGHQVKTLAQGTSRWQVGDVEGIPQWEMQRQSRGVIR